MKKVVLQSIKEGSANSFRYSYTHNKEISSKIDILRNKEG
jgi:hypothetical protein